MSSGFTPTYLLPYPINTDPVDVAGDMQSLATATENVLLTKAPLASPALTGTPTAPTASSNTNTTQIATTAFVINQGYLKSSTASSLYAPIASPTFTGTVSAPTPTVGDNSTKIATTQFVSTALSNFVTLPVQTGANGKFLKSDGTAASWQNITTTDVQGLSSVISGLSSSYSPLNITIESKSATSYTLVLSDSSKQIEMNSTSANILYIPSNASVPLAIGTTLLVVQTGTGQTTIAASVPATTTINGTPGLKLRTQYSVAMLVKRAADLWLVSGDIVS